MDAAALSFCFQAMLQGCQLSFFQRNCLCIFAFLRQVDFARPGCAPFSVGKRSRCLQLTVTCNETHPRKPDKRLASVAAIWRHKAAFLAVSHRVRDSVLQRPNERPRLHRL
uniref:Uncharacterized protein n=1 Tax=Toxoplasma gondii COUG TaxID=1074873 RepID=A0A2G8Y1Y7_TOXGO|nr:hypothetical protein TGCOUG_393120 [Toxoplasma gondii COUG]